MRYNNLETISPIGIGEPKQLPLDIFAFTKKDIYWFEQNPFSLTPEQLKRLQIYAYDNRLPPQEALYAMRIEDIRDHEQR